MSRLGEAACLGLVLGAFVPNVAAAIIVAVLVSMVVSVERTTGVLALSLVVKCPTVPAPCQDRQDTGIRCPRIDGAVDG